QCQARNRLRDVREPHRPPPHPRPPRQRHPRRQPDPRRHQDRDEHQLHMLHRQRQYLLNHPLSIYSYSAPSASSVTSKSSPLPQSSRNRFPLVPSAPSRLGGENLSVTFSALLSAFSAPEFTRIGR